MRFLVDECSGPALAQWLQSHGHDVFSVYDEARGMDDDEIVQKAFAENRILVTNERLWRTGVSRATAAHRYHPFASRR